MRRLENFLYDRWDAILIDGTGLQPDPELAARNLQRAREVIKQMGSKWCCYVEKRDPAGENELMLSSHSHTEF